MAILTVRDFNTSRFAQMADSSEANISSVIARAEAAIRRRLQRPIEPEVFTEVFYPDGNTIYLRNRPVLTKVGDTLTPPQISIGTRYMAPFTNPMYSLDAKSGILHFPNTLKGRTVTVTYTAGFDPIPEDIKEAVTMQAVLFLYTDLEVYGAGDGKEPGILYFSRDIDKLLQPYKQLHMAYT